jgi:hypothetical protein
MDRLLNPFAPGAGTRPPELAGRQEIIDQAILALHRIKAGRSERSPMLVGLRGVGKTVLLVEIRRRAEATGFQCLMVESREKENIARLLAPGLRKLLLNLDAREARGEMVRRGVRVLRSFLSTIKVRHGDTEISMEGPKESGVADSGHIESDLSDIFLALSAAAQESKTAVAILIDEMQYISEEELGALIMAVHRVVQEGLPLILIGAGLPQLAGKTGRAKSYAERLFIFPVVGPLSEGDARTALQEPVREQNVAFSEDALREIYQQTQGYPYFLQEWGSQCWNVASQSPIGVEVVAQARDRAISNLDTSFFRVRFDRLTPREKDYLRAMAELGSAPQRSGDIAQLLGTTTERVAPLRAGLIGKGMIYSPQHGDTAFTVPLFDQFMKRMMPVFLLEPPSRRQKTPKE